MGISRLGALGVDPAEFCRFDPVPEEGIARAVEIMKSGEIFRYSGSSSYDCEVVLLEREIADYVGTKYALAVNSCSKAIQLALAASGVGAGSKVLVPPSPLPLFLARSFCSGPCRFSSSVLRITASTLMIFEGRSRRKRPFCFFLTCGAMSPTWTR